MLSIYSNPGVCILCELLMTKGGSVTNANQITAMRKTSHLPTAIVIVHCRSHQTDDSIVSKGNNWADKAAWPGALRSLNSSHPTHDILTLQTASPLSLPDTGQSLSYLHQLFHPNSQLLFYIFKKPPPAYSFDLSYLKPITDSCKICQVSDSNSRYCTTPFPTHQARSFLPGTDWKLNFTHMPKVNGVLKHTCVEAFLTTNKKAQRVSDLLPQETIPWFGVAAFLKSHNS